MVAEQCIRTFLWIFFWSFFISQNSVLWLRLVCVWVAATGAGKESGWWNRRWVAISCFAFRSEWTLVTHFPGNDTLRTFLQIASCNIVTARTAFSGRAFSGRAFSGSAFSDTACNDTTGHQAYRGDLREAVRMFEHFNHNIMRLWFITDFSLALLEQNAPFFNRPNTQTNQTSFYVSGRPMLKKRVIFFCREFWI